MIVRVDLASVQELLSASLNVLHLWSFWGRPGLAMIWCHTVKVYWEGCLTPDLAFLAQGSERKLCHLKPIYSGIKEEVKLSDL